MSKKNILFISYDGMTDPLGQSQVIPYLKGLSKKGYSIFLLSCEKKIAYNQNKEGAEKLFIGFDIKWFPIRYSKRPPVVSTLWDIMMLKAEAKKIHLKYGMKMVHTRPGIPALIGLWMKQKFGIKFLNDIREFYADSRVEGGMWDINKKFYRIIYEYFKRMEAKAVKLNDGIVCLTYAAEKIITGWPAYKGSIPLEVIPCSVDLILFDPEQLNAQLKAKFKTELGISDEDIIISYLGSVGGWYLTDEMLEFCKLISDKIPSAKFLFISPHKHEIILEMAHKWGIAPGRIIVKHGKRDEIPVLLCFSKYCFFFIKQCYSKMSSSPTKHGEIMAMGIPVITNGGVGDVAEIVKKYNGGILLKDFDENSYLAALDTIVHGNGYSQSEIRQGACEFYSLDNAIEKYSGLYGKILDAC